MRIGAVTMIKDKRGAAIFNATFDALEPAVLIKHEDLTAILEAYGKYGVRLVATRHLAVAKSEAVSAAMLEMLVKFKFAASGLYVLARQGDLMEEAALLAVP